MRYLNWSSHGENGGDDIIREGVAPTVKGGDGSTKEREGRTLSVADLS